MKTTIKTVELDGERVPVFYPQISGKKAIIAEAVLKQLITMLSFTDFHRIAESLIERIATMQSEALATAGLGHSSVQPDNLDNDTQRLEKLCELLEQELQYHRSVNLIREYYEIPELLPCIVALEDLKNECDLNGFESQSPEC